MKCGKNIKNVMQMWISILSTGTFIFDPMIVQGKKWSEGIMLPKMLLWEFIYFCKKRLNGIFKKLCGYETW